MYTYIVLLCITANICRPFQESDKAYTSRAGLGSPAAARTTKACHDPN